jgi:hypothetical protein
MLLTYSLLEITTMAYNFSSVAGYCTSTILAVDDDE